MLGFIHKLQDLERRGAELLMTQVGPRHKIAKETFA